MILKRPPTHTDQRDRVDQGPGLGLTCRLMCMCGKKMDNLGARCNRLGLLECLDCQARATARRKEAARA